MIKNIVISGASKGLGLVITKTLLKKGYKIYAINRSITQDLEDLKSMYKNNLFILQYDLSNTDDIRDKIFKNFIQLRTPIHGYINNAAMAYDDIITNLNLKYLHKMFKINVFSPFILTKYIIRQMLLNKIEGSIVHISSISVHTGYKGLSMYAASKGAIEAFSKNTAREWGERGIRSNCLVAGFMETNMSSSLTKEQKNRIYNRTSLKKPTSIQSVTDMIEFLLSEKACSLSGQNIFVDSGTI